MPRMDKWGVQGLSKDAIQSGIVMNSFTCCTCNHVREALVWSPLCQPAPSIPCWKFKLLITNFITGWIQCTTWMLCVVYISTCKETESCPKCSAQCSEAFWTESTLRNSNLVRISRNRINDTGKSRWVTGVLTLRPDVRRVSWQHMCQHLQRESTRQYSWLCKTAAGITVWPGTWLEFTRSTLFRSELSGLYLCLPEPSRGLTACLIPFITSPCPPNSE